MSNKPKILKIDNLRPYTRYKVFFTKNDFCTFKTISLTNNSHKIIIVSGDHSYDDKDYRTLKKISDEK